MKRREFTGILLSSSVSLALDSRARASIGGVGAALGLYGSGGSQSFDFYISPTGNDANAGTLGSPWTIASLSPYSTGSAATNYATLSGKKIGLLPGTYDVSALCTTASSSGDGTNAHALDIPGGTAVASTYIGSSNSSGFYQARTATIEGNGNGFYGGGNANACTMIGHSGNTAKYANVGYVTFDGLILSGASIWCMTIGQIAGTNSAPAGIVVQNCKFTGNSAQNSTVASGKNVGCISVMSGNGIVITNNVFNNNQGWTDGQHFSAIYHWGLGQGTQGTQITFNTFTNSGGLQGKEQSQINTTIAYNYIDMTTVTPGGQLTLLAPIWGFCGAGSNGTVNLSGTLSTIHHNILISYTGSSAISPAELGGTWLDLWYSNGQQYWSYPVQVYNNTCVATSDLNGCGVNIARGTTASPPVTFYNNGFYEGTFNAVNQYGWFFTQENSFALCDYNIYGTNQGASNWANFSANGSTSLGTISATAATFAAWKTDIGSLDANSSTSSTNPFTNNGALALQYQVQSGSPWFGTGKIGGTSGGGSCNVGAWDGTVTQIGANFT